MLDTIVDQMTVISCFVDYFFHAQPKVVPHACPRFSAAEVLTVALLQGVFEVAPLKRTYRLAASDWLTASPPLAVLQPSILNRDMGQHRWYVHRSRLDGADMGVIKSAVQQLRKDCADKGINLVIGLGPTLLADLTDDVPTDFRAYETLVSTDGSGKEAKGTQEELLFWLNSRIGTKSGRRSGMLGKP